MIRDVDLLKVYEAVKARLKTVGLTTYDFVPGASEWPAAFILPPTVESHGLADDLYRLEFEIVVMVSGAVDENQLQLLRHQSGKGDKSISYAFESEPTLSGLVGDVRIVRSRPLSYEEQAGYQGFGAVFEAVAFIG